MSLAAKELDIETATKVLQDIWINIDENVRAVKEQKKLKDTDSTD